MYETWERPKAITDSRHMMEVKHKIDSEYQASLRRKEQDRELSEKKREQQISKQQRRWLTLSSIYSTRSYERPWAAGMVTNAQAAVIGVSEGRWNNSKSLVKKPVPKLPAIASVTDKKKYKPTSILKSGGITFDLTNPAAQPQVLSKRTRLHQRRLSGRAMLPSTRVPRESKEPTSLLPEKPSGTRAPVRGDGRDQDGTSGSDKRSATGKSSANFFQQNKDVKATEGGVFKIRGGHMQLHNSPATSILSTCSQRLNGSSPIQVTELSQTAPNSFGANGSLASQLSRPSRAGPRSTVVHGTPPSHVSEPFQGSPTTSETNDSSCSQIIGPSLTPVSTSGANGLSVSQFTEPCHARSSSAEARGSSQSQLSESQHSPTISLNVNGSPFSQRNGSSHTPLSSTSANCPPLNHLNGPTHVSPRSLGVNGSLLSNPYGSSHASPSSLSANGSSVSQLNGPSHAATTSMPSRTVTFRFREEDYHSLNTVVENEDPTGDLLEEDDLSIGDRTPEPFVTENSRCWQTSFPQFAPSDLGHQFQNGGNDSVRLMELPSGSSTQGSTATILHGPILVDHEVQSSQLVDSPAVPLNRFNCDEDTSTSINREIQHNENIAGPNYVGVSLSRSTSLTQVLPSPLSSPTSLSATQRPTSPINRNAESSLEEVLDANESSRFNAPRRPLSPIRSRFSLTTSRNNEDMLEPRLASEMSRSRGSRFASPSQRPALQRDDEDTVAISDSSTEASYTASLHLNLPHAHSMRSSLQESLPLALLAMSDLHPQSGMVDRMGLFPPAAAKETKPKADPEKLRQLKESLLEEDSEEEGDLCRICLIPGGTEDNPLLEPCRCGGSLQYVHKECLTRWIKAKITSGADLDAVKTCELCRQSLECDFGDFNLEDFYNTRQQSEMFNSRSITDQISLLEHSALPANYSCLSQSELMNSGLYLMLLLHLYEQRYAELLRLTHSRARRDMLFRNYQQLRADSNESRESGDTNEDSEYRSPSSIS
ncbi:probable E3 ubiquitin-protein ligase MARCHF10 isoform X2 [Ambystoma mexicanum]|uniref:probable E3 ubiquitin-protein ligase MARCHF10 isoform X2 n=1 Tax=Ambystoma mexicanum TaxID=8296 RepID=UPI0037E90BD9